MSTETLSLADHAVEFYRNGIPPVWIEPRTKAPTGKDWPERRYRDEQAVRRAFSRDSNLGALLGAGIADVDLDCDAAIRAAPMLLPATPARSGRATAPGSHWWYRIEDQAEAYFKHTGANREVLVELRAQHGKQTVVPPSTHKDTGEVLRWEGAGRPWDAPEVPLGELSAAVAAVAVVSALEPYWPGAGSRNEAYLRLAGGLLRTAPEDDALVDYTERVITALAHLTNDEEADQRAAATVGPTSRSLAAGKETTGWTSLAEIVDEKAVAAARKAADELISALGITTQDFSAISGPSTWGDAGLVSHQRIAARLASYVDGKCLFVHGSGWHYWDGQRWAPDNGKAHVNSHLTELLRNSWMEAMTDKALQSDVRSAMSASGARGVLELASTRADLRAEEVDTDPYLLNCANGTLDLRTLELRAPNPADRITKVTAAAYRPDAASRDWDHFLETSLPKPEVRAFLQRYAGLSLIGRVIEHLLVIANGSGRNGKGILAYAIQKALGDYSVTASNDLLTTGRHGHKSAGELSAQMQLRGARWVVMSEINKGDRLNEATMKSLTGGDVMAAKSMGKDYVNFLPSHSILMLTNDLPSVPADAQGVWERMRVVPFDVSFRGHEDTTLEQRLERQLDAVLTWAVEGLREYQLLGDSLAPPPAVMAKTEAYRNENDPVSQFIEERCVLGAKYRVRRSRFLDAFNTWAWHNGEASRTAKEMAALMREREGISGGKVDGGAQGWKGVNIVDDQDF